VEKCEKKRNGKVEVRKKGNCRVVHLSSEGRERMGGERGGGKEGERGNRHSGVFVHVSHFALIGYGAGARVVKKKRGWRKKEERGSKKPHEICTQEKSCEDRRRGEGGKVPFQPLLRQSRTREVWSELEGRGRMEGKEEKKRIC